MSTTGSLSNRERLVVIAGIVLVLAVVTIASAFLVPGKTLAQSAETNRANSLPARASTPPPPPPAIQVNAPAGTPEPGAVEASAGLPSGSSDLEVVRFRPQVSLRRGESPPAATAAKPADAARSSGLKRPLGEAAGPQEDYQAPDVAGLLSPLDWNPLVYEDFEGIFPGVWILEDFGDDGGLYLDRTWGDTNYYAQFGNWSAWPAAGGVDALDPWYDWYSDNLNSWMKYGPLDLSNMTDVFVSFGLWYDTEPVFDNMYFCASVDSENYSCVSWSGYSGGWTDQAFWLTSYAGYSQVWLAWVFVSDESISQYYEGPFVDEVWVWGDEIGAPVPTPTPDPAGELIQNGSFETGDLTHWDWSSSSSVSALREGIAQPPALRPDVDHKLGSGGVGPLQGELDIAGVEVISTTYVDGQYSARLWRPDDGTDFLYQAFDVPADVTDLVLNYWFAVTTYETTLSRDFFCASLRPTADLGAIWVDLGCVDSTDASGYWQEVVYTLTSAEVGQVAGETVALIFELYNAGGAGTNTAGWVDYVSAYATGSGAGGYIDPNEPNDDYSEATPINCSDTITGVIGEAAGGYDVDWFELVGVPEGRIDVDIDADTQVPPSALDSVVDLWDDSLALVAWNDDDGVSFDSHVVYTNTADGATFYISVESYWGYGGPDSFYDLTVQCDGTGAGLAPPGGEEPAPVDTWTVMLYLNAEDPSFESILTQYRTDIEAFIGSKSGFLNVAILYDGSGVNDTTRYLVQPNGSYTLGTNKWNLGERNMGHPDTLANFVTWAMDQYPAENYYLAVDDHGDGVYGISYDSTSNNDQLTPPELYSALKSATQNGTREIDIFDYEACLMGLAENAYDVREWVRYVIFFEQISWGINTYPRYFHDLEADDSPREVGWRIVDRYYAEAVSANNGRGYPHTISLIDTGQMATVSAAVSDFGEVLSTTATITDVKNARYQSQAFAADIDATNPYRAEYIDLWDLADNASGLAPSQAAAVKAAVDAAVVHEQHASGGVSGYIWDHSGVHGLSIYYPPTPSSSAFDNYVAESIYQMSRGDGHWDEFLAWAVSGGTRRGMSASRAEIKLAGAEDAFVFKYVYLPAVLK